MLPIGVAASQRKSMNTKLFNKRILKTGFILLILLTGLLPLVLIAESLQPPKWIGVNEFRGGINLRWFRVQGATSYEVLKKTGEEGSFKQIAKVPNPAFDDFQVKSGQVYFYKVVPYDKSNNAGPPSEVRFYKLAPPEPEILTSPVWSAHQIREDGIAISWIHGAPENVLAYNLYRKKSDESTFNLMFSSIDTNYLDKDVTKGVTYEYAVTALDKKLQESDFSNVLKIRNVLKKKEALADSRLAGIKTLEQVVNRTQLVESYSWEKYGFISPVDVDYSPVSKRLYVADSGTGLITVIDERGEVVKSLGGRGTNPWHFDRLMGITVDSDEYLYAVDAYEGEVVVFNSRLAFEKRIQLLDEVYDFFGEDFLSRYPWFRFGLTDVDLAPDGTLLVLDNPNGWIYVVNEFDRIINVIGEKGYDTGFMHYPTFLKSADKNSIYVSDSLNARVQEFDSQGAPVSIFGERGLGIGQFLRPKGIAVDTRGFIYVADSGHNVIQVFNRDGQFTALLGNEKGLPIDLGSPNGMVFVEPDRLIVAEKLARRVQVRRVPLDSTLSLVAKDLEKSGGVPIPREQPVRQRTKVKLPPSPYSAQVEKIVVLGERGGLATIGAPLFENGTATLRPKAEDVLNAIAKLSKDPDLRIRLKVLAMDKEGMQASPGLAKDRIAVIRRYIVSPSDSIKFYTMGAVSQGTLKDMIEITVERVK
jgi:DNA-binding beta-propeller fold protein YncE